MKTINILVLIVLVGMCTFSSRSSMAQIYKWVDDEGNVHFTDLPPADKKTEQVATQINTYESTELMDLNRDFGQSQKIIMYSTIWCGVCKKAKKYFEKNRIAYVEYDVEKSEKGKRDFKKLGGKGVPVILVGDKRLNGFSKERFEAAYKK